MHLRKGWAKKDLLDLSLKSGSKEDGHTNRLCACRFSFTALLCFCITSANKLINSNSLKILKIPHHYTKYYVAKNGLIASLNCEQHTKAANTEKYTIFILKIWEMRTNLTWSGAVPLWILDLSLSYSSWENRVHVRGRMTYGLKSLLCQSSHPKVSLTPTVPTVSPCTPGQLIFMRK